MMKHWAAPSIVVEDVDTMQVKGLDFQRALPPSSPPTQRPKPEMLTFRPVPNITICPPTPNSPVSSHKSFPGAIIQPQVEAYVTPLSLCGSGSDEQQDHQPNIQHSSPSYHEKAMSTPSMGPSKPGKGAGSESSFTSVDIGGAPCRILGGGGEELTWNSWNDSDVSGQTETGGCCFEFQSGMNSVVRAVAACATISSNVSPHNKPGGAHHHRCVDMSDVVYPVLPLPATAARNPKKKRMSKCTMVGIAFLVLAVAGLIAVGIAMYIEFVTKPIGHQKLPVILNQTAICDYLINGCEDGTNGTSSLMNLMANRTKNVVQNETGKVEASFSSSFKNQLNSQLSKTA